ncbi:glycosyltransferase family 4 protein [[Clostridium] fimetarium]|uniref:Uncharacterized protein n=1 Tax=[Clostridium] fimetarium TaxID=99656 RepID=A0A1I0P4D1_9FIRM|nr:glycosyltransferase family 4 protein [[Clostridium] fimetarium]SEW09211.1 hypothetical protein SAMN05421659_104153 [[Clostridium] fimetarium]
MAHLYFNRFVKNENGLINTVRKYPFVIVYGAGLVGSLTVKRLLANKIEEEKLIIAVGNDQPNHTKILCGIKVYTIEEVLQYVSNALVIIATMPGLHEGVFESLDMKGFQHIIPVSLYIYNNMCEKYVQNFCEVNPINIDKNVKTKIMFMASDNSITSGAFLCMVELCISLKQYGVEVIVILPCYGNGEILLKKAEICYTYLLSTHWGYEISREHDYFYKSIFKYKLLRNKKASQKLVHMIQLYGINLVHCNTSYTYVGAKAARQLGTPFVWHIREDMNDQGYNFYCYKKASQLIEHSNLVIFVSNYMKSKVQLGTSNQTVVLYDAVNFADELYIAPREILNEATVKMILVGAISPHKGQKELIEACAYLKNNNFTDFQLLLVGKGEEHYVKELRKQVKLYQLEDYIIFYGQSDEVKRLYENSDFSFMCSNAEPYGRVTIEAQLAGCLVIGSASGATTELIEDGKTGYLYDTGNVQDLADCIYRAISDVKCSRRIAKFGQCYAQKTYTKQNQLKRMIEMYENVLERTLI